MTEIGFKVPGARIPVPEAPTEEQKAAIAKGTAVGVALKLARQHVPHPTTAAELVFFAVSAGIEAELSVVNESKCLDPDEAEDIVDDAKEAGAIAFALCLPDLTSRRSIQAYIGCVAEGLKHGWIAEKQTRSMLYAAQVALAALSRRKRK